MSKRKKRRSRQIEERSVISGTHPRDPALAALFPGQPNRSGVSVDQDTALSFSAVFAGIRFLSDLLASLNWDIYRDLGNKAREDLPGHRLWRIINTEAND